MTAPMYCADAEKMKKTSGGILAGDIETLFSECGLPACGAGEPLTRRVRDRSCRFPETAVEIAANRHQGSR